MLRFAILTSALLGATSLNAQVGRGLDDGGNCVSPCERADGLPCQPCWPVTGPGAPGWIGAVDRYARESDRFQAAIRERALRDRLYSQSEQYLVDLRASKALESSVQALRIVAHLANPE